VNEVQHARDQENEAYGAFLIETIAKSCGFKGTEPDLAKPNHGIDRAVYKGTSCGAWVRFDSEGVMVGTIVEGSDAEFSERIDLTGIDISEEGETILLERFWDAVQQCEDFADEAWAERNAGDEEDE
jgi:hypothetical protein